jgi:hypothetical protein
MSTRSQLVIRKEIRNVAAAALSFVELARTPSTLEIPVLTAGPLTAEELPLEGEERSARIEWEDEDAVGRQREGSGRWTGKAC